MERVTPCLSQNPVEEPYFQKLENILKVNEHQSNIQDNNRAPYISAVKDRVLRLSSINGS